MKQKTKILKNILSDLKLKGLFNGYEPHIWQVDKTDIYSAIHGLELGLQNTEELLRKHQEKMSETSRIDKLIAEIYVRDISIISSAIKSLKENPKKDISLKIV